MSDKKTESRGKSWKREREERGRRQLAHKDRGTSGDSTEGVRNKDNSEKYANEQNADVTCASKQESEDKGDQLKSETDIHKAETEPSSVDETVLHAEEVENLEEQKKELMQFISEVSDKLKAKAELKSVNANAEPNRPEESFFGRLDSSLKKNTAFIKRLRNMTEAQKDSLIRDMNSLNLTKYISEAASAIVDAKLKMSDVNTAIHICSILHQRYSDFSAQLLEHWQKVLPMKKDEKILNPSKIRVDLRFYAELVSCGVFHLKEGLPLLGNLLTVLTASDKEEHGNVNILLSFCRHCGEDYAGLLPRKYRVLNEKFNLDIPKSNFLPADRQKGLRNLLKEYYKSLCKHLVRDYKILQNMEKQNHRIMQTKGEISTERKDKFEAAQVAFQKLLSNAQQFADIVDEDIPDLPKDESFTPDSDTTIDVHNRFKDDHDGSLSVPQPSSL